MATRGKQVQATTLCYLAGVIDSDGCISISKMKAGKQGTKAPRYVLTVNVVNTSEVLMRWLVENFGGRYKNRVRVSLAHRQTFDWFYCNGKAADLLTLVEPFLLVKREQARLGLIFIREGRWLSSKLGTPAYEVERRETCYRRMKALNQTGCAAATTKSSGSCEVLQDDAIV